VVRFPLGPRDFSLFQNFQIGCGTHRLLFNGYCGQSGWGLKLTTDLYVVPKLKVSGIISPHSYAFMTYAGTVVHFFAFLFTIICLAVLQIVACSACEYMVNVILLDTRKSLGCVLGTSQDLLQYKRKRKSMFRVGIEPAFRFCTRSETCPPLV
jgi:hypothetical protein